MRIRDFSRIFCSGALSLQSGTVEDIRNETVGNGHSLKLVLKHLHCGFRKGTKVLPHEWNPRSRRIIMQGIAPRNQSRLRAQCLQYLVKPVPESFHGSDDGGAVRRQFFHIALQWNGIQKTALRPDHRTAKPPPMPCRVFLESSGTYEIIQRVHIGNQKRNDAMPSAV